MSSDLQTGLEKLRDHTAKLREYSPKKCALVYFALSLKSFEVFLQDGGLSKYR
jgi:hypothetical protein